MNSDQSFIRGTYVLTLYLWLVTMVGSLVCHKQWIALSITLGVALSVVLLMSLEWVICRAFIPGAERPARALWKLMLVKYPLLAVMLYWVVRWDNINLLAFVGGFVLVHFAIVIKTISRMITERTGITDPEFTGLHNREN